MSRISYSGANAQLAYTLSNGLNTAQLRCTQLSISYGVNSEESHARTMRAFYPHLRVQGSFSMTFEFKGWREHRDGMSWFRDYVNAVLAAKDPSPMFVKLDERNFVRFGVPTSGIIFGDHVGSMVFSPTITFVSVSDPRDAQTAIINIQDASRTSLPAKDQTAAQWFYPESRLNSPGQLQQFIYDQYLLSAAQQAADVASTVNGDSTTFHGRYGGRAVI